MFTYVLRRLIMIPVTLLGVTLLVFAMMQLLDPYQLLSAYVSSPAELKGQNIERLITKYGLDQPLPVKYTRWLGQVVKGDLGWSESASMPVGKAIRTKFPLTFELALYAFFPIILGGIWLGKLMAVRHNSVFDHATRVTVIVGWSFPDFVFGLLVILIFYSWLGWFPPGVLSNWASRVVESADYVRYTGLLSIDALLNGRLDIFWDALRHLLGPVTTMTYLWSAFLIRITRSGMLDVLHKDYIRTARAKGLPEKMVIHKHASKNAMISVITVAGRLVIYLLTGTVIIETIFNRPGMGKFVAFAAQQLDYSGILGGTLFFSLVLVVGNLIVDVLYAVYDPRIQLG